MNWRTWLVTVLLVAVFTHVLVLFAAPYAMMAGLTYTIGKDVGYGQLMITDQPEHGKDKVVRSSPDLLYSICAFNLKDGPLRIQSPGSKDYMSVSFFSHNTDNFFAINDKQAPQGFDLLLAETGTDVALPPGARLLETDSPYGVVLFRYYLGNRQASELDALRQSASCEFVNVVVEKSQKGT